MMKNALQLLWKVIDHNRGAAAALLITGMMMSWAAGCQSTAMSPMTDRRLSSQQLAIEESAAYDSLMAQAAKLRHQYDTAFAEIERQERVKEIVFSWARPIAESFVGNAAVGGAVIGLIGVLVDNRRKDKLIRRAKPLAPP